VLSTVIAEGLKDPRIGFVTVTSVQTSADLRHAKVFVSVLGSQREREQTLAGLHSSHGYLQDRVAAAVRLKRTPQLEFLYDASVDHGMRIQELLQRYEGELRTPTDDAGAGGGEGDADQGETAGGSEPETVEERPDDGGSAEEAG
jgi:ribosome-binding factor A